jgi:AcrR family transcriptional regulator
MVRKYEQRQRADSRAQTRQRIVEATVALHETVGPAYTTISAIAEAARVQRLTVYRHFADDRALFSACSGHWAAENPLPDPREWEAVPDPAERLGIALPEIYAFFRRTEGMTGNLLRDLPELSVLQEVAEPFFQYWETVRRTLDRGWTTRGHRRLLTRAVIGHAVHFESWCSLVRQQGLDDLTAANLMVSLARAV